MTAPELSPEIKKRLKTRNRITTGMETRRVAPAYSLARAAWIPTLVIWHADGRFTRLEGSAVRGLRGGAGREPARVLQAGGEHRGMKGTSRSPLSS